MTLTLLTLLLSPSPADGVRIEHYEGPLAYGFTIAPPWAAGGKLVINLPEHLEYEARGMGILRHNDKERRGTWEVAADGKSATLDVESPTAPGVRVRGEARVAGPERVEIAIAIANGGKIPLASVKPLYCVHYRHLAGFPQWVDNFKHVYVLRGGKAVALADVPTKDPQTKIKGGTVAGCAQHDNGFAEKNGGLVEDGVDAAVAAVESLDRKRNVAVAWTPGKSFLSNAHIPCLHADPFYGTIAPGASAEARGVVLFSEGPVEAVMARARGAEGLAAKVPGDVGLKSDPAVLLVEDFESDPKTVSWMKPDGWFDAVSFAPGAGMELTEKVAAGGKRSLQYNLKKGKQSSGGMFHKIKPSPTLHYRYYRMFEKGWEWPKGYGPHDVGIYGWKGEFPGPSNADLCFLADFWMTGDTVVRINTPRQKVDPNRWMKENAGAPAPPGGHGLPWNRSKPDPIVPGQWHCVEVMAKVSSPGKSDGAAKLWVNGKLVSDVSGLPLRDEDHADMLFTLFFVGPYFHPGSPKDQVHWIDQIVVATEYIGPVRKK